MSALRHRLDLLENVVTTVEAGSSNSVDNGVVVVDQAAVNGLVVSNQASVTPHLKAHLQS